MLPIWTISLLLFTSTFAMDNLRVAYQWKELDFDFPSASAREEAIKSGKFIPENNLPLGLEVYKDRLFITVPRWRSGVAASLNYIKLSDPMDSPKLKPYPNWEAHKSHSGDPPEIVSPFRVRADHCGRLWVLDTGIEDFTNPKTHKPVTLLIYDLHNDNLMRSFKIPKGQVKSESFLANIAVEDHNCADTYAYLGDLGDPPGIIVYSWKKGESWRVEHNYFSIDPLMGEFNVSGITFVWNDGLFGMALSKPDHDGFSTLYFHPMSSTNEFSVSTKYLREDSSKEHFHEFKLLGTRGPKGQSGVSFLDQKTDVLFYSLLNLNAVACWRTTNPAYTMESQGRVYMNNVTMIFPNDIKVDNDDNLWVLSDRLPMFLYSHLDKNDVNFRVLTAPVADAIRGTACDSKLVTRIKSNDLKNGGLRKSAVGGVVLVMFVAIMNL
ncbi:yellow-b isoform X1 [Tribolium castaneum]|nr:yellow-b precursor [Tribolium castaneum]XP_008197172.1 PREDICTED: yellow-b isoform X1 [Tribolium castaneum]|eukprot:NP_001161777.1 yellow-b precursor [Tribolium castaneum]